MDDGFIHIHPYGWWDSGVPLRIMCTLSVSPFHPVLAGIGMGHLWSVQMGDDAYLSCHWCLRTYQEEEGARQWGGRYTANAQAGEYGVCTLLSIMHLAMSYDNPP